MVLVEFGASVASPGVMDRLISNPLFLSSLTLVGGCEVESQYALRRVTPRVKGHVYG